MYRPSPGKFCRDLVLELLVGVLQVAHHDSHRFMGGATVQAPLGARGGPRGLCLPPGCHQALPPNPHGQHPQHMQCIIPDLLQGGDGFAKSYTSMAILQLVSLLAKYVFIAMTALAAECKKAACQADLERLLTIVFIISLSDQKHSCTQIAALRQDRRLTDCGSTIL